MRKVNSVNARLSKDKQAFQQRIAEMEAEKVTLEAQVADLQKEVADLKSKLEAAGSTPSTAATGDAAPANQSVIDEAVKSAVSAREAELEAQHKAALDAATNAGTGEPSGNGIDQAAFESKLADAVSQKSAELQASNATLKGQVDEMQIRMKLLEKQAKTAEITRKTLERTKADLEIKLKNMEGGAASTSSSASTAGLPANPSTANANTNLSAKAPEFKPPTGPAATAGAGPSSTTGLAPNTALTTPTAPASSAGGAGTSVRGTAAGRARGARGTAVRGRGAGPARGNTILNGKWGAVYLSHQLRLSSALQVLLLETGNMELFIKPATAEPCIQSYILIVSRQRHAIASHPSSSCYHSYIPDTRPQTTCP